MEGEPPIINFREALNYWIRLGLINFGGPAGQIALMHRELVERRRWISEEDFLRALNFCMLLPGPEAQQLATYIGWRLHGIWGGVMAGIWFILPSAFVLLVLSWLLAAHRDLTPVSGALYGVQPVVVAIVAGAVLRMGRRTLRSWGLGLFASGAFFAIFVLDIPFPAIVLTSGLLGLILVRWWPSTFLTGYHQQLRDCELARTNTFPPLSRLVKIVAIFLALWIAPFGFLILWQGFPSIYTDLAFFFTKTAFVTFGGAYAVLSYIADASVRVYGWLEPGQMVQGLALAESTPGPLIMVTQYVGFMAGWRLHGEMTPFWSGSLASVVTTYYTFLPCFFFIFAGAPYIEALAGGQHLQAALVGITAAVVGVILNLAIFFGRHVLLPNGQPDEFAFGLALTAFFVLQRFHWQIPAVVSGGAIAGLAWKLSRPLLGI